MKYILIIIVLLLCASCKMTIGMTEAQKEQKKFNRFHPRQDDSRVIQVAGFVGISLTQYLIQQKQAKR